VGPRTTLGVLEKRTIYGSCWKLNHRLSCPYLSDSADDIIQAHICLGT